MTKQEARDRMRGLRKELTAGERESRDQAIRKNVLDFLAEQGKPWLFSFVSYGTEADTYGIIRQVLAEGEMKVAAPRVAGREMEFYRITSIDELQPGYQGIPEPVITECVRAEDGVMLLPGLAFDLEKNRVGYGGGFYDRYLERCNLKLLATAGIAYDFQIVDRISTEPFDCRVQWIITDKRTL